MMSMNKLFTCGKINGLQPVKGYWNGKRNKLKNAYTLLPDQTTQTNKAQGFLTASCFQSAEHPLANECNQPSWIQSAVWEWRPNHQIQAPQTSQQHTARSSRAPVLLHFMVRCPFHDRQLPPPSQVVIQASIWTHLRDPVLQLQSCWATGVQRFDLPGLHWVNRKCLGLHICRMLPK